jgi:hypothetical protein
MPGIRATWVSNCHPTLWPTATNAVPRQPVRRTATLQTLGAGGLDRAAFAAWWDTVVTAVVTSYRDRQ